VAILLKKVTPFTNWLHSIFIEQKRKGLDLEEEISNFAPRSLCEYDSPWIFRRKIAIP
jgi:hypothetical protein